MHHLQHQIGYLKECYQADTRSLSISNIFQSKVEDRLFFEGEEYLISGQLNHLPLERSYAEEVLKNLGIYKREKKLYYCAFFLVGMQPDIKGKSGKVCAPIILYPAEIVNDQDGYCLQIDRAKRILNINAFSALRKSDADNFYDQINDCFSRPLDDIEAIGHLVRVLESHLEVDAKELLLFPKFMAGESKIKRLLQPKKLNAQNEYKVLSAATLCTLKRSTNTRGISAELQELTKAQCYSGALRYILDEEVNEEANKYENTEVPALLSTAQKESIKAVSQFKGTCIIGPPGTGKSYTIATIALSNLARGKTTLIACKTDEAVDVVYKKIENDLGFKQVAMRAGRSDYKKSLKTLLQDLLTSTRRRPGDHSEKLSQLQTDLSLIRKELSSSSEFFAEQIQKDLRWGRFLAGYSDSSGLISRLKIRYLRWKVRKKEPHWKVSSLFLLSSAKYIDLLHTYILTSFNLRIHEALYSSRTMFRDFLKSISARNSGRQEELFKGIDINSLLETFPIWLSNASDIHEVLPMVRDLFDVVIIDEASQCDISSALPVLQRGKRFAVVGDPKQLRHVSFVSQSMQSSIAKKYAIPHNHQIDYRSISILDFALERCANQRQIVFLNEHFRSKPGIIDYSNKHFYNEGLSIMTSLKGMGENQSVELVSTPGKRDSKGVNREEARLIVDRVKAIVEDERNLSERLSQSIGILSPFRDQVEFIGDLLLREFDSAVVKKHQIVCGTAYSFQGEERDIMLLSFAIDDESHHAAVLHLNKDDVFNVSVTRARSLQIVYTSFSKAFDPGHHVSSYISKLRNGSQESFTNVGKDKFMLDVKSSLELVGFECWVKYAIGGLSVDLLCKRGEELIGINLIGYPGEFEDALRIEDYKILKRAGLSTFPLPYPYWYFDKQKCLEEILAFARGSHKM